MNLPEVDNSLYHIPEYDQATRNHYWIVMNTFKWDPENTDGVILDHNNLVSVSGPGCYYCMQQYTPFLAMYRCKGPED